jgi:ribosomal protein L23|tara:strand:+ start:1232 stop:1696 length:465 start_codon:yes stop_codon:yes gene_type:complete
MSDWFTVKIKYLKQLDNGSITSKSEAYMLQSLSFTEAEARLQGILEEYISEYNLLTVAKTNIQDVIIDEAYEFFFKVKVSYISADPDSGKEKKINENYIIQANGLKEAYEKMEVRLQGSIVDWEIPSISKATIVDVFPYIEETIIEEEKEIAEA